MIEVKAISVDDPSQRRTLNEIKMLDDLHVSVEKRVSDVVKRLLIERSIVRVALPAEDLRDVGLSSLDMVHLVLSIEAEFDVTISEGKITPANFRCISAISHLLASMLHGA